jgi:hypothetical protein
MAVGFREFGLVFEDDGRGEELCEVSMGETMTLGTAETAVSFVSTPLNIVGELGV